MLPRRSRKHDSIMVVVENLSRSTHFIYVQSTFGTTRILDIFIQEVIRLHGIMKMVLYERDSKFTSKFLKTLFGGMGTKIYSSTVYHPRSDGKIERTN